MTRDQILDLPDEALLGLCETQGYKGSGPGGQHRNKTLTGVRLVCKPYALEVSVCEDRSAIVNRKIALKRLRERIALEIRETPAPPSPSPGAQSRKSPLWLAHALDSIAAFGGDLKQAAAPLGLSTTALTRQIFDNKFALEKVQKIRAEGGLPALRT
jgi:hypothetical protein